MSFLQTESTFRDDAGSTSATSDPLTSTSTLRNAPRVFIVDADEVARKSSAALLVREGWCPEVFVSGEEFLAHPVGLAPGCLILDVSLPGLCGLELQRRASVKCPHIPTIFLSAKSDIPTTVEAMKAGAHEFLTKPFQDDTLLSAVREALDRSHLVLARRSERQALQECYASLSLRQRQVMLLVASGLMNKQVGAELGISEITVKAHRSQMMQKMQANSLPDLVKMAGKLGLARRSDRTVLHGHAGQASRKGGQANGTYAFVA